MQTWVQLVLAAAGVQVGVIVASATFAHAVSKDCWHTDTTCTQLWSAGCYFLFMAATGIPTFRVHFHFCFAPETRKIDPRATLLCTAAAPVVCSAACHAAALTLFRIMYMEPSSDPGPGFVLGTLGAACTVAPVLVLLCCNACARCAALCEPTGSTGQWFLMYTQ